MLDEKFIARTKNNLSWDSPEVRQATAAIMDLYNNANEIKKESTKGLSVAEAGVEKASNYALNNKGDVALGAKLFNKQNCVACHAVNSKGQQKGPFLGSAGSQFERKFIIESILDPLATIAQGFPTYLIDFKNEQVIGFLVKEDNVNYYLMNMAGIYLEANKESVKSKKILTISQMPPGLVYDLNLHEFTSLIEYLHSMK